jgi:hypothetical protein
MVRLSVRAAPSTEPGEKSANSARTPATLPLNDNLILVYRLSVALAGLLCVASVIGLAFGWSGLYEPYPAALAGLVGQDIVTLAIGLPLLLGAMRLARRGSARGLLLWAGALFYIAYSYYFFLVGGFNALFLVYVAIVATSLYALLALLFRIDADALTAQFTDRAPVRRVAIFFVVISILFAVMWGGLSIASALTGTTPGPVVHLVVAIDGAVLLPLLLWGGVKLWRREPWGYLLGGLLLTKATATGFTLAFTSALALWWAGRVDPFEASLALLFGVMALAGVTLLITYLRSAAAPDRDASQTRSSTRRIGPHRPARESSVQA